MSVLKKLETRLIDLSAECDELKTKLEKANEKLRWRKWPDERPEDEASVIFDGGVFEYMERSVDSEGDMWGDEYGNAYDCEAGDLWLPIPNAEDS